MERMREEFEGWVVSALGCDVADISKDKHGVYNSFQTGNLYVAWTASRKALCVKLPTFENGSIRGYSGDCEEALMVVDCVGESLEKAGVSYE